MKVIFHVVEEKKWKATIENAKDILNNDPDAEIAIVCMADAARIFGGNIGYMTDDFIELVKHPNVAFIIGKKGLENNYLTEEMLPVSFKVEKSVVKFIVELQNQGYAYIRL